VKCFYSADDPAKTSAAATSDSDSVKVADATESASELNNHDTRVSSHQSELMVSDSNASVSIDDEDDRVLFNGDIVCSEHGKIIDISRISKKCRSGNLLPLKRDSSRYL